MARFIDDHREAYGVEPICRVLPIAPSVYYEQKARQADPRRLPKRLARECELRVEIERVWKENQSVYGARKVWKQMKRDDLDAVAAALNGRPRKTLNWKSPAEVLEDHLRSAQQGSVATNP